MTIVNSDLCRVRLDSMGDFEDICARLSQEAISMGYERPWTALENRHGQVGTLAFVTLHENWASLGSQAPPTEVFEQVLGESEGRQAFREANACLESTESIVAIQRPDLSYSEGAVTNVPTMMQFTQGRARRGGQDAVEELLRKIAEAIPKVDDSITFRAYETLVGDRQMYTSVVPLTGLADLDRMVPFPELLTQAFGAAEGGLIYRSGREAIESLETSIVVVREDLSNPGPAS